ncbi:MAG: hypothetical protein AAFV26_05500, partial [Pseudomonadota bacterium]
AGAAIAATMMFAAAPGANAAALKLATPAPIAASVETAAPGVQKVGFKKRRKFGFRKHFGHRFKKFGHFKRYHYVSKYRGCGFLKRKWKRTGSFYWKRRYFICRGWY